MRKKVYWNKRKKIVVELESKEITKTKNSANVENANESKCVDLLYEVLEWGFTNAGELISYCFLRSIGI